MAKQQQKLVEAEADLNVLLESLEQSEPEAVQTVVPPAPEISPVLEAAPIACPEPEQPGEAAIDVHGLVNAHTRDYEQVRRNLFSDRAKIDSVVAILLGKLRTNDASAEETDSLVKVLGVLADTNGHSVKLLDSRSKLLAASKSALQVVMQQNNSTGDADLIRALEQPASDDEI